jgi:pyruvate dehydrogenase E1 component alpha subunit
MSDPAQYRSRDEVREVRDHSDPIENIKNKIITKKYLTEKEVLSINNEIKEIIDNSARFAESSPLPQPDELYKDVYM